MSNINSTIFNNILTTESEWTVVTKKCPEGKKCPNEACSKTHPKNWNWKNNVNCNSPDCCSDRDCEFIHNEGHSWEKYNLCEFGAQCKNSKCKFAHTCNLYDCIGIGCIYDHKHEHCIKGVKSICSEIGCMPCRHCKCKSSNHDGLCKKCFDKETEKCELRDSMECYFRHKYRY